MKPPLKEMTIRTPSLDRTRYPKLNSLKYEFGGTMGMGVRSGGKRNHGGWDLYASPGTTAYAISDCLFTRSGVMHGYGNYLLLEFSYNQKTLYALYAHLTKSLVQAPKGIGPSKIPEGTPVALTGTTGNAGGEPPHLHFEIWTKPNPGLFPDGRISPGEVLGYFYDRMDNRAIYLDRA